MFGTHKRLCRSKLEEFDKEERVVEPTWVIVKLNPLPSLTCSDPLQFVLDVKLEGSLVM